MKCPECGAYCDCESVDVGVGTINGPWQCSECPWDEDCMFPMTDVDWEKWLNTNCVEF